MHLKLRIPLTVRVHSRKYTPGFNDSSLIIEDYTSTCNTEYTNYDFYDSLLAWTRLKLRVNSQSLITKSKAGFMRSLSSPAISMMSSASPERQDPIGSTGLHL